ncbi:hypothetical protein Bbelb_432330 [Branchiostoma belcheri]|nr:hypothetical protein Bbelb_432330 [Branchiostoma belcheri]
MARTFSPSPSPHLARRQPRSCTHPAPPAVLTMGGGRGQRRGESAHRALILSLLMPAAAPAFCSARQSWSNIYTCETRLSSSPPCPQDYRADKSPDKTAQLFLIICEIIEKNAAALLRGLVPVEGKSSLEKAAGDRNNRRQGSKTAFLATRQLNVAGNVHDYSKNADARVSWIVQKSRAVGSSFLNLTLTLTLFLGF